jgi:hypothetical protein
VILAVAATAARGVSAQQAVRAVRVPAVCLHNCMCTGRVAGAQLLLYARVESGLLPLLLLLLQVQLEGLGSMLAFGNFLALLSGSFYELMEKHNRMGPRWEDGAGGGTAAASCSAVQGAHSTLAATVCAIVHCKCSAVPVMRACCSCVARTRIGFHSTERAVTGMAQANQLVLLQQCTVHETPSGLDSSGRQYTALRAALPLVAAIWNDLYIRRQLHHQHCLPVYSSTTWRLTVPHHQQPQLCWVSSVDCCL